MPEIALIGLGNMGEAIGRRLLDQGATLDVWNRSAPPVERLAAEGARALKRPQEAFDAGTVISMLADDAASLAVFDDATLADAAGALHINLASVSVAAARELAERHRRHGVRYVAAPVLGRPPVAESGELIIVAAGAPDAVEAAMPVLELLAKRVEIVGADPSQANLLKIGVNYNLIHALQALGESCALIERGGIDAGQFVDILTDTAFTGSAYQGYGPLVADRRYRPAGFTLALGRKDLGLAADAAEEVGAALPTLPALTSMFDQALARDELDGADWSAIAEVIRDGAPAAEPAEPTPRGGAIRHVVCFRLRDSDPEQRAADLGRLVAVLEPLADRIDGCLDLSVGVDDSGIAGHWDAVLVSHHVDEDALAAYQAHPAHIRAVELLNEIVVDRAIVDAPAK